MRMEVSFKDKILVKHRRHACLIRFVTTSKVVRSDWGTFGVSSILIKI